MALNFLDPLVELTAALRGDTGLTALVPALSIGNHLPQDRPMPYIRYRYDPGSDWSQKDSAGLDGTIIIDLWTDQHGDKHLLQMMTEIHRVLYNLPFAGTTQQSLLLQFDSSTFFYEPDGVTHHGVMNFRYILTN